MKVTGGGHRQLVGTGSPRSLRQAWHQTPAPTDESY